jgi:hypothetical protein
MPRLKIGTCIICRLREKTVINPYTSDYDQEASFDIIASDNLGYYLYIPPYTFIKGSVRADSFLLKQLSLNKKYLGDEILYIREGFVYKVKSEVDGCTCDRCKDFFHQAAPNQDNDGFLCWSCRADPYR